MFLPRTERSQVAGVRGNLPGTVQYSTLTTRYYPWKLERSTIVSLKMSRKLQPFGRLTVWAPNPANEEGKRTDPCAQLK